MILVFHIIVMSLLMNPNLSYMSIFAKKLYLEKVSIK